MKIEDITPNFSKLFLYCAKQHEQSHSKRNQHELKQRSLSDLSKNQASHVAAYFKQMHKFLMKLKTSKPCFSKNEICGLSNLLKMNPSRFKNENFQFFLR